MGEEALEAFEAANPPDLVVEVEPSRGEEAKSRVCRELGVFEMWCIDITRARREGAILDLNAPEGTAPLPASTVLLLCIPDFVLEPLKLAIDGLIRDLDALVDRQTEL